MAIAAVARIAAARPALDVTFEVYGRGDTGPALAAQAAELGIADRVTFHGRIPIEDVPAAVAGADIGLAPTRHDQFTDMSLSTKVFEYAAMGKPVVASRLPMVERTFPPGTVAAYEPGDAQAMADAILAFADDPVAREAAVAATAEIVQDRLLGARVEGLSRARGATDRRLGGRPADGHGTPATRARGRI